MGLRVIPRVALPLVVQGLLGFCLAAAAPGADPAPSSVLHLTNGDFVPGELRGSEDPKVLRWRSPFFAQPLEFPLSAVNAVHYAVPAQPAKPPGAYCFELVDDDVLYGDLVGLTEDDVEVESAGIGRLRLPREHIRRLYRWKGADSIYLGPNGLAGWKDSSATPQWRDEGGQLLTDQAGAALFGDLGLPEKAVIEVEFSWKRRPNFVFALGVDDHDAAAPYAFHFEVWDDELVVVGESARDADMASVQQLAPGEGSVRVLAYLDQAQRRLIVLSRNGKPLANLKVNPKNAQVRPGVRLTNRKGDLRLEHLRVTRWNGLPPRDVREDQSRLHRTDGSIVYGQLTAYDPKAKQFTVRDGETETVVKEEAITDVFLSPGRFAGRAAAETSERTLRVVYRDGSRFSGTLTRLEDGHLTLRCPGVKEPLRLPLADLRSLVALRQRSGPAVPAAAGKPGRLELDGVRLKGRLVDGAEQPGASCLVWHPDLGLNASPLLPGVSGRIVYRDPPPQQTVTSAQRMVLDDGRVVIREVLGDGRAVIREMAVGGGAMVGGARVQGGLIAKSSSATARPTAPAGRPALHLRSGDTIPCEVTRIDEKGVAFKTPLSDATFVPHEKVKSVELIALRDAPQLDEGKRDRLLTLPRMQKDAPPTHLICSRNGDFLRGRVVEMDDARLKVEVRLETREVPRDRVVQIIWLHPDELAGGKAAPKRADAPRATRVQTVRANGNRLTFVAEKSDPKTIWGTSDVLGACRAELADVDQVLFGTFIEESAAQLADHRWKLHHAPEPKFAQADADAAADGRLSGTESPLVGQPAFPFKLDLLDGSKFQLADRKGRVVVLDFWATWCGPCLEALPLVEGVVREFADRNVELVAVNLEEQPEQVKAMLQRHKLKVPVALDRDGKVAARYAVTAIPQTVVIDRDGKVARLFVGGGKKTAESLRKVLEELAGGKPPAAAP
jgi:thiol-disulfide isomerase/thioredoxin